MKQWIHTPVLLGDSAAMRAVRDEIARASRTSSKVLIRGETGVGKEVVARLIHVQGARAGGPFVAVNCSGLPETLLESELFGHVRGSFTGAFRDKPGLVRQAQGGTLFLDELGEMSLRMQSVLLRFAETGEIQPIGADVPVGRSDARLITATNRDLRARIEEGAFREDLFYRLNVIPIAVPPLRDHPEDVPLLLDHYLQVAGAVHQQPCPAVTPAAREALGAYRWPGNVRELKNVAERLMLFARTRPVDVADLPAEIVAATGRGRPADGDRADAARSDRPPLAASPTNETVTRLWQRLLAGESFWTAVHQPFKNRELTRQDLAALIDVGLRHANGHYAGLLKVVNLPPTDYKRFHAFLYQQKCNLPVRAYRVGAAKP